MEHYAGIDVSLELSSVSFVDGRGKSVKEAKVASEPGAFVYFFKELGFPVNRIGFEAGPLSQWLHAGLTQAGLGRLDQELTAIMIDSMRTNVDSRINCCSGSDWERGCLKPCTHKSRSVGCSTGMSAGFAPRRILST